MFLTFPSFSAGELSPLLEGRSDLSALKSGCILARNVIPQKLGPLLQRPGFMYRGLTDYQGAERVSQIPFVVSASVAYKIEVGPFYFRFWRDNALILTAAGNVGMPGVVSAVGDPLMIATPYAASTLFELQYCAANDVMWIAHEDYPVQKLIRYAEDEFEFAPMTFVFPPLRDINSEEITLAASGTLTVGGSVSLTAAGGDVFEAGDVGGYFGIDHRRDTPYAEISLSQGSGTASALLIFAGNAVAGETVSIGTGANLRTYTWDAVAPYGVPVGGTALDSCGSLTDAINGATAALPGTIAHPSVTADDLGDFPSNVKASGVLSFIGDNDLTAGTPDEFIIGAQTYTWSDDVSAGSAYEVQVGATLADSIANAILAINATGTPGVNYTAGTAANTDVTADAAAIGSSLRVQAITAGAAGNAITTTVDHTSRMEWSGVALTGGADASTCQIKVSSRLQGAVGNAIAVSETMTNAAWQPTSALTGGADNTNFDPSNEAAVIPTVRVNGTWEVYTLGRWYGLLTLQQQRSTGEWETVRTWESKNDRNVQATGTVDGEKLMRLTFVGSGVADDDAPARAVLTAVDAIVHGLVLITNVISATSATGIVVRDIWSTDPTYLWAEGSWSARRGYPAAVVLHQQRLTFGQVSRIIGSQTGGFDNFERTELADSSYQYDLASTSQANIVALHSQAGLTILTEDSEWLADGGTEGGVISPAGIRVQKLTEYGAAKGTSQIVGSNVCFIQAGGRIANEYLFEWANQDFTAVDLGELADHLTSEGLKQIGFAPNPHSLLYFITDEGSLLSLAYRRKPGGADQGGMLAWTKLTTPDGGESGDGWFESVCVVPGSNELSDVSVIVRRRLGDGSFVRTFESYDLDYWDNLTGGVAALPVLCCLDGAIVATGIVPASPVVTGLDHLEGLTVAVLLNGVRHADRVVSAGQISLEMGEATEATVVVGLAPLVLVQPWFVSLQTRDGGTDGRSFMVKKLNTRFYLSGSCQYADSPDSQFYEVDFRSGLDLVGEPVPLKTGLIPNKQDIGGSSRMQTAFIYRNSSPLPMNLLGVTAEVSVG